MCPQAAPYLSSHYLPHQDSEGHGYGIKEIGGAFIKIGIVHPACLKQPPVKVLFTHFLG
jgi:hypothetical protein